MNIEFIPDPPHPNHPLLDTQGESLFQFGIAPGKKELSRVVSTTSHRATNGYIKFHLPIGFPTGVSCLITSDCPKLVRSNHHLAGEKRASSTKEAILYEPVHEISNNVVCATSKASDQPAHTRSLIRAFASRLSI